MELTALNGDRTLLGIITNQYSNGRGPNAHALVRPASLPLARSGQGICGTAQQDHNLIFKGYELPTRFLSPFQKPWVCPSYPSEEPRNRHDGQKHPFSTLLHGPCASTWRSQRPKPDSRTSSESVVQGVQQDSWRWRHPGMVIGTKMLQTDNSSETLSSA